MIRNSGRLKKPFPSDSANIFSKIFLTWTWPIFCVGYRKELDYDDLYTCSKYDDADLVGEQLEREWRKELKKSNPCLWKAIARAFYRSYIKCVLTIGVLEELGIRIAQPFMLGGLLDFFKGGGSETSTFYLLVTGFLLCSGTFVVSHHPFFIANARHGMRARIATQRLVLNKLLVVSKGELYNRDVGQIINLISNDVQKFDACAFFLPYLLLVPIQTIVISILLWHDLGFAYLAGFMVIVLFVPLQGLIGRQFSSARRGTAKFTDQRIRLMSEIINGIQVIKMYSWEKAFANKIAAIRRKEIGKIRMGCFLRAINLALSFVVTRTILFACFITYIFYGNTLSAKTVFVSMAFFNSLKITLTFLFPTAIANLSEACVSCHRINKFLLLKEISNHNPHHIQSPTSPNDEKSIFVENLEAMWDSSSNESCLKNISFSVKSGELLTVVGPVGSGKTSLFQCLLNEIVIKSGKITINGIISYASQDDWIFNASVKDNIIFGEPFDEQKYRKVIRATALDRDIEIFPHKDLTMVGERGVGLSGGQRARVSLARAIYHEADIYLLDDPLAAVDSQVAEHIFSRCCRDYLKSKIVILVTHHFHFLRRSDKILLLDQGQGKQFNSYAELQNSGSDMMTILEMDKQQSENRLPRVRNDSSSLMKRLSSSDSFEMTLETEMDVPSINEEVRKTGSVSAKVYWTYIKSGASILLFIITLFINVLSQVLFSVNDMYLAWWTNFISQKGSNLTNSSNIVEVSSDIHVNSSIGKLEIILADEEPNPNDNFYTMIYSGLVVSLFISAILRSLLFFYMCNRASIRLHDSIFYRLLRSPLSLFEQNPVGRILNRFSSDLGVIDELLPATAFDQIMNSFIIIGVLVVVSVVAWYMIIPAVLLIFIVFFLRSIYIKTGRDVKRIESLARSPIYSHVSTIVDGLATIRSSKKEELFRREFSCYLNDHSAIYYLYQATSRALGVWTDWSGYIYIITTTLVVVIFKDTVPPGSAGLALTQILLLTGMFQWFVRQSAELESQMTSVERIAEYTELPTEAELVAKKRPPPDWPNEGNIRFEKVSLRYPSSQKPSLSDVDLEIKSGEKIGIVGRSGAGKSSLVSCLFRLVEVEGKIIIDGIDISKIGLQDLREKISIIPQEPVIFAGTVRSNLDPFNKSTDLDLWEVLDDVQLKEKVQDSPGNLNHEIREGGDNFSVGQRQLICLARALLRKNKILVIDEATANVDLVTDDLIQRTIRTKFAHCTVLTIAHRLNTIIDSDRVLVLDAGRVKEFDPPHVLLQQKDSIFSHLVAKTGSSMSKKLRALAGEYYENSKNKKNR